MVDKKEDFYSVASLNIIFIPFLFFCGLETSSSVDLQELNAALNGTMAGF